MPNIHTPTLDPVATPRSKTGAIYVQSSKNNPPQQTIANTIPTIKPADT